jgi:acetyl esterase/lipase
MAMRLLILSLFGLSLLATSAAMADDPKTYPLWPKGAPGSVDKDGVAGTDAGDENHAGDIPTITVYLPPKEKATGASIVICPGGGYSFLATDHEGKQVAEWLNSIGVAGVVLKYRLAPKYKHPVPLGDAQRAVRMVRWKSKEWGLDPKRVGILGFSAGGHLASTAATHFMDAHPVPGDAIDGYTTRPELAILVYPVIAIGTEFGHNGSRDNLLGKDAPKKLVMSLSNETQVNEKTPPTFLAHTLADTGVPVENSILFAMALRKHKVPFELHIFEKGQHGLGLGTGWKGQIEGEPSFAAWPKLCEAFLKTRGFLDKP